MNRLLLLGCVGWACAFMVSVAAAQPALERLEKQLLGQPEVAPQLKPPANAPPGNGAPGNPPPAREPGYLGVLTRDNPPPGSYIQVVEVLPNGPAALAGLKVGDLIIRVDEQATRRMADLAPLLERSLAGDALTFTVLRGRDEQELVVTLGRRPPPAERKFEAFGPVKQQGQPQQQQELPPPDGNGPPPRVDRSPEQPPLARAPAAIPRDDDKARIDLLERRVAELERRLAELERLLERRP